MKTIIVDDKTRAELVGRLYFEEDLLNTEQLTLIKHQMHSPKFDYNADTKSLWALYNHITLSLHKSHPKDWLDHQRLVHWFFTQEYGIQPLVLQEDTPNEVTENVQEIVQIIQPTLANIVNITIPREDPIQEIENPFLKEDVIIKIDKPVIEQLDLLDAIKEAESEGNLNHL
jgi:hypothetical protein